MKERLRINYFSDLLCVWAWIAERRNQALTDDFGQSVERSDHYLGLFSDTGARIGKGWEDRGGFEGFGDHVRRAAEPYPDAEVHADVWTRCRPKTSANAHLVLKATEIISAGAGAGLARSLRERFFVHAEDIGRLDVLLDAAEQCGVSSSEVRGMLDDGTAIAALLSDDKLAQSFAIKGSPSWVMNSGRQLLYGNVGYRVLHANVEELLRSPAHEASWC